MSGPRRLWRLLVLSHVGLVLALVLLLLATGIETLRASLQDRAEGQATRAATETLARLDVQRRELLATADLLGERPSLHGYLRRGQPKAAAAFVETFRATAQVDFIAVYRRGELFVATGVQPPDTERPGLQQEPDGTLWRVESTAVPDAPMQTRILVAQRVGRDVLPADGEVRLRLLTAADILEPAAGGDDELRTAYRHAWLTGRAETLGPLGDAAVLRIEPVRLDGRADIDALLVASVPRDAFREEALGWLLAFALGSLLVAALAAGVAVWLARRIARPFDRLAESARRLGVGDLETPVELPDTELAEPLALAHSLEGMRRQLRAATGQERRQRRELDMVLEGVGDAVVAVDGDEVIRYANRQCLALLGLPEDAVLGRRFDEVLHPAGDAAPASPLREARTGGLAQTAGRYRVRGGERNLVIRAAAPIGERQVAMLREETSEEASRAMRDAILANLSHEFQTPLSAQMAAIELLRDHLRDGDDPVAAQLVAAQYRAALRLSQLVDNLLDSLRLESGEMRLRDEEVDLVAVMEDALALMQPLLEQRGQRVDARLPRSARRLRGDGQRLSQVAVNLLANANKFAPDDSTIWVELDWGADTVSLWIEDEGPGLPGPDAHADLFAPFRRAPRDEPSQRGTGLGLAIVRALVERHGGQVVVAPPRHRQGARFGVVLPLGQGSEARGQGPGDAEGPEARGEEPGKAEGSEARGQGPGNSGQ
ncbi:sensor histidine kinase [Luteimonas huabeiensis]|uniref:sensor histidine kinase n=1 Tax=Luteimonas huabeiensis TaxID=1244513 RepID=UPI0004645E3D|nr:ATP-binding protein [Luteimonas huabeiensis]